MAARPQEAPPFSVPCSRRHFTLITMRLAPSSLPQPLESLTPLGLPSCLPPLPLNLSGTSSPNSILLLSFRGTYTQSTRPTQSMLAPVTVLNVAVRPAR